MATRFIEGTDEISLTIWTIIIDDKENPYVLRTHHLGHYGTWKEVIQNRIISHFHRVRLSDIIPSVLKRIEIKKEDHIIKHNNLKGGHRIGIDGTDEIYIRKNHLIRFEL
ncbi:hypothetical protein [Zunongwangia sp. HGR-M22]|uniref:hypothetical protein n=1 Tax=Zunongwangia sp. HGR-M22 TaxID=3015168 RepID=UPI0022DD4733|nr:hypothetical protein [Zunongwangia sp. HGR-M22]WBL25100.1 hypothetical protein PBT91_14500 [Zunongwangia sp. HGR-M22]